MEQEFEYKNEIVSSRVGCLGGSDGNILAHTAMLEQVPKSAYKRLAICKGLIPYDDTPKTAAMRAGDVYENYIFNSLKAQNDKWQSNTLLVSENYSTENCKLICHPDMMLEDEENKVLRIYEIKSTKDDLKATRIKYRNQLWIENQLAKEYVCRHKKGHWKVELFLVVYNTNGIDLTSGEYPFEADRISKERIMFKGQVFNIGRSMQIISNFLKTFTEYYNEEINANLLPAKVKDYFLSIVDIEKEIKAKKEIIDEAKKKLCDFFIDKGIKSVKNDDYNVVLVEPTTTIKFDKDRLKEERPTLYKKYCKTSERNAYVKITPKNK